MRQRTRRGQSASRSGRSAGINPSTCPKCAYSFRGLPIDHACPECGFQRDEHTLVFEARGLRGITLLSLVATSVWGCFVFALAQAMSLLLVLAVGAIIAEAISLPVFIVALTAYPTYLAVRVCSRRRYVAVTPAGIHVRSLSEECFIPWSEFRYVQMYALIPTIFADGDEPYRVSLMGVLGSRRRFDAFDEAAEAAVERWRKRAESPAQTDGE